MGTNLTPNDAASARLRRHGSRTLERAVSNASCSLLLKGIFGLRTPRTPVTDYHLLRHAGELRRIPLPLVVMTPKSLLRLEAASGSLDDMATGSFAPVIDDPHIEDRKSIERVVLCTGKIYYDLVQSEQYAKLKKTAIVRVEQLSPLPYPQINEILASYSNKKHVIWVQEEPKNMGARDYVRPPSATKIATKRSISNTSAARIARVRQKAMLAAHAVEQERIIAAAH